MSKQEHDAAVAELRKGISTLAKPWYRSSSELLIRMGIQGKKCLDLCCGNGEFSHILRDRHAMDVTCADYIPFHLQHAQDQGFSTILVDIDASEKEVDVAAALMLASLTLLSIWQQLSMSLTQIIYYVSPILS